MFSFLNNIPQVTKNILLLNIAFWIATMVLKSNGIYLVQTLGGYYINSPLFEPYQVITHFFMHSDNSIMHIVMNMLVLVLFGSFLEKKLWGAKRFFIFYIISAIGAFLLYNIIGMYQIYEIRSLYPAGTISELDSLFLQGMTMRDLDPQLKLYEIYCNTPMVGASGAIFGVGAAFAILQPNTEIPIYGVYIKAKFLVGGYFLYELLNSFKGSEGDHVAHLAHVGGAITGAIIVFIWRKTDRNNFW